MKQDIIESVIGKIQNVEFLKAGRSAAGKDWKKFRVIINGDTFVSFEDSYELLVGSEGEWPFINKIWKDKIGIEHLDKQLLRPREGGVPIKTTYSRVNDESKILEKMAGQIDDLWQAWKAKQK